jgi:hypothetical protein
MMRCLKRGHRKCSNLFFFCINVILKNVIDTIKYCNILGGGVIENVKPSYRGL